MRPAGAGSAASRLHGLVVQCPDTRLTYQVVNPSREHGRRFENDRIDGYLSGLNWVGNWEYLDDRFGLALPTAVGADPLELPQVVLLLGAAAPSVLTLDGGRWYTPYMLQVHSRERSQGVGRLGMMLAAARAHELGCVGMALQVLDESVSAGARRLQMSIGAHAHTFLIDGGRPWVAERGCTTWCVGPQTTADLAQAFASLSERRRIP